MRLGLAIHDEASWGNIAQAMPKTVIDWIEELVAADPDVWTADWPSLTKQYSAYSEFVKAFPFPMTSSGQMRVEFVTARMLARLPTATWQDVTTADTGEYAIAKQTSMVAGATPPQDIYAARHGQIWCARANDWWRGVAERLVVLTTERLPTAIAKRSDPYWQVLELDAADLPRHAVDVHPKRGVTGANLLDLCTEWRNEKGDDFFIISNRVKQLDRSMPHITARGDNTLAGQRVLQTMTYMTPEEYEVLQALNAWVGVKNCIILRHVDEFNQSAGRNLGFRFKSPAEHHLLVGHRLLNRLIDEGAGYLHYDLRIHLSRDARYEVRRGAGG